MDAYNVDQEHQADVCAIRYLSASGKDVDKAAHGFLKNGPKVTRAQQNDEGWSQLMYKLTRDHPEYTDRANVIMEAIEYYSVNDPSITVSSRRLAAASDERGRKDSSNPVFGAISSLVRGVGSAIDAGVKGASSFLPKSHPERPDTRQATTCTSHNPLLRTDSQNCK